MINNLFSIAGKNYQQPAPLFLRAAIGFGFMAHGWAKLSKGPEAFGNLLAQIHVPFPHVMAWISTFTELLGGLAIFIGLMVSITAIPLIGMMLVAMFGIQIHYGFSSVKTIGLTPGGPVFGPPGYEINLLYIAGLIALLISGAGIFSADSLLAAKRRAAKP
ncbi:DoxX family protein [Mucilaginibacter sp. SMC90]|uniref:DoxX family protein n=1 Tax=Mucilaginibacter sp. SMC90 TaxID=2929803 RepID=UPI001FB51EDE|nr:DoxX family protein [Mucilaginibacter sp. SMC90]UOE50703.1 DoxX family protein [Mucilaginibacter sp. SMC90]